MTATKLTDLQLLNLSRAFAALVDQMDWRWPGVGESEPKYTSSVVLPSVRRWLPALAKPGLFTRGDGGVAPLPVFRFGVSFIPDLEIDFYEQRCLAVEVKFVRDSDPSGSISKAVGQSTLYQSAGFAHSHVILIDCRTRSAHAADVEVPGIVVQLVRPKRS